MRTPRPVHSSLAAYAPLLLPLLRAAPGSTDSSLSCTRQSRRGTPASCSTWCRRCQFKAAHTVCLSC
eukprot:551938-Rhodomonas_salina.1